MAKAEDNWTRNLRFYPTAPMQQRVWPDHLLSGDACSKLPKIDKHTSLGKNYIIVKTTLKISLSLLITREISFYTMSVGEFNLVSTQLISN